MKLCVQSKCPPGKKLDSFGQTIAAFFEASKYLTRTNSLRTRKRVLGYFSRQDRLGWTVCDDVSQYLIDYSRFHSTIAVDMPPYSAKQLRAGRRTSSSSSSSLSSASADEDAAATASVRSAPHAKPIDVGATPCK